MADWKQTYASWYLSVTTLAGLPLNAMLGSWWADPVVGLVIVVFLLREALEARPADLLVTKRLAEPPEPSGWLWSASGGPSRGGRRH